MRTRESMPWPYRRERAWVLLLMVLSILLPALVGLRDVANITVTALGMLAASAYAFRRRQVLGFRWAVFALGLALVFALGLVIAAFADLPGGGSSVSEALAEKPL